MSRLGEKLAWALNQKFPTLAIHRELQQAKSDIAANQNWAYLEAKKIVAAFDPYWNLSGKHVLDIGTGLGGKLPFYFECGALTVNGIDISLSSLRISKELFYSTEAYLPFNRAISFTNSDAAYLPYKSDSFDAIISINVFEHILNLKPAVDEAFRVLKPGGLAYLHLPPYYSPWGPHLENWIHFPWPHLLFSDKTLMNVAAREDSARQLNDQFVPAARIDWVKNADLVPDVNKVTLRQFRKLVLEAGFTIVQLNLLPVGYDNFQESSRSVKPILYRLVKAGSQVPLLQEIIVTKMVFVLQK